MVSIDYNFIFRATRVDFPVVKTYNDYQHFFIYYYIVNFCRG